MRYSKPPPRKRGNILDSTQTRVADRGTNNSGASAQYYTVTAGKKLYLSAVFVSSDITAQFAFRDAIADDGPILFMVRLTAGVTLPLYFNPPLQVVNGLRFDAGDQTAACSYLAAYSGWEE